MSIDSKFKRCTEGIFSVRNEAPVVDESPEYKLPAMIRRMAEWITTSNLKSTRKGTTEMD